MTPDVAAFKEPSGNEIRVTFITTVPHSLGFLEGLVGFLKSNRVVISAISSPGPELIEFGQNENIPVYEVEMPRRISPFRDLAGIRRLRRRLLQIRPHVLHALTPKAGLLGMIAAVLAGVPVRLYHIVGFKYLTTTGIKRRLLRRSEWLACRLAHEVLCVSPSLLAFSISDGICPKSKIKTLVNGSINGVDSEVRFNRSRLRADTIESVRKSYSIPPVCPTIGYVGRIVSDKGIKELIEAWRTLREEWLESHLLIVGRIEALDPLPYEVLKMMHKDTRIHVTGFVPDVTLLYTAMDVLVLPTYREGFPNTLLEASAMGLPVVATRVLGCEDAVQDETTGLLVPPRSSEALAGAIRRYLSDPELRISHGKAGRERVVRDFQPHPIWEATLREYCSLLSKRGTIPTLS